VVITIAISGCLECPADGGDEAVAALEPVAAWGASNGTSQLWLVVPEGGHLDAA